MRNQGFSLSLLAGLLFMAALPSSASGPKVHTVGMGTIKRVPYSSVTDPAGALPNEKELRIRPLVVDTRLKEWTTGEQHAITDRSFAVRRALRLNDSLPGDKSEHWIWQRGPWLLVDRTNGHYTALKLPDYDPAVSTVVWYRDYAAYCGLTATGRQLYAVVAQLGARKPVLARKLAPWTPGLSAGAAGGCTAASWQREPLQVTFQHIGDASVSYDLIGLSAVLVEDGDSGEDSGSPAKSTEGATGLQ